MATYLNVYDLTRKKTAVLQNAFDIVETHELNQIYSLSFTISAEDEKVKFLQPRHYIRWGDTGELYRIKTPKYSESDTSTITYECEHVITTLCDNIMFGSFNMGGAGIYTSNVITALLNKQTDKNWRLGTCAFRRQFEYLWEQENLLNALYSIPREFSTPYMWTFDTVNYPWTINLVEINTSINPQYYLRAKSNILAAGSSADYANVCTRIYPLGYGEGVNQLNIKSVNNGVPYLQSPSTYTDKYGIVEKVLVDRRFENAESLKAYAQSMLDVYQEPTMSRSFDVTDLYPLTRQSWDEAEVGRICRMTQDNTTAYITKTIRQLDKAGSLQIDLSTKATDIASNVADLADRIRIESVYAQGATQLYQHSKDANATSTKGMVISLYFPSEMRQINKVLMRLKLGKFRSYSQATDSKVVTVNTCENKVVTVATNQTALSGQKTTLNGGGTTSSSGGTSVTVGGGATAENSSNTGNKSVSANFSASAVSYAPQSTTTSQPNTNLTSGTVWPSDNSNFYTNALGYNLSTYGTTDTGDYMFTAGPGSINYDTHTHRIERTLAHTHTISTTGFQLSMRKGDFAHSHNINHYHYVSVSGTTSGGSHSHSFNLPNHTHTISAHSHNLPDLSHNHSITLNGHTHTITLNSHSHDISAGIFESGNPTSFDIYVGSTKKTTVNATSYDGDITPWILNNKNQIPRDQWIDIEIRPNDLAYVTSSVFVQGFVQSRGGGNY